MKSVEPPPDLENIDAARFLKQSGHYSIAKGVVKTPAFLPPADMRLSVFDISSLDKKDVLEISNTCVKNEQTPNIYGYGKFNTDAIYREGLIVDYDNNPPRHMTIMGWPGEKDMRMLIAQSIAQNSTLELF